MTKYLNQIKEASEQEKFHCIYKNYNRLLYKIAYDILQNNEDAKEAVQEAFIRIVQNLSKISDPFCPETKNYVVIICKNISLTMLKKRNRMDAEELHDYFYDERHEANPHNVASVNDTIRTVVEVILDMPEHYRDCLYLELIQEFDYLEIADILGLKPETVRKRVQRGKKQLREKLMERGVGYED
jgi:RNA polymerase sigma-70 factor (ECF subfamily)